MKLTQEIKITVTLDIKDEAKAVENLLAQGVIQHADGLYAHTENCLSELVSELYREAEENSYESEVCKLEIEVDVL